MTGPPMDAAKVRAIYGKGYADGINARQVVEHEEGDSLNANRLRNIESNQSAIARKVLDCVPIQEIWTAQAIFQEMARRNQSIARNVLDGCLNSLVDSGLIKEPRPGNFQRVYVKPEIVKQHPQGDKSPEVADPLDMLAELAKRIRAAGSEVNGLASKVEDVALEVQRKIDRIHADAEKLKQLQQLLKGLGD